MAKKIMPSKGVPFSIEDWPSVVLEGLRIMNENNWFPMMTLIVGNPGETDEDVMATLDLVYEIERRGLFAFLVPSIFTPLARHENGKPEGSESHSGFDAAAVAADDEVLEDEFAAGPVQLVGTDCLASGLDSNVALQAEASQWPKLHLAAVDVFRCVL